MLTSSNKSSEREPKQFYAKTKSFIRTGLMTTTRLYGPCWMRRERPTLIGRTDQTVPHSATDTGTVKPEPRESFAACNTESGSRKMKKCSSTPPRTAPRCFAVLSRPSMTLPEVERPPPPPSTPLHVRRWPNLHQRQRRNQSKIGGAFRPTPNPITYSRPGSIAANTSEASTRRP